MTRFPLLAMLASLSAFLFASARATGAPALTPAFPGAEGFGAHALGGRGGNVYIVNTLADYDPRHAEPIPGSFRAALEADGPRTVLFSVSGNIELKAPLWVFNHRLTIAGQTAPGDGICIRNYPVILRNEDVVIRYLRFRLGDAASEDGDALRTALSHNVIIDHCSFSWGTDACLRIGRAAENVTVQWCLIGEALGRSSNGFGAVLAENAISFHHNLIAHCRARNPKVFLGLLDFRNNVIYDWEEEAGVSTDDVPLWINYVGNRYLAGPSTSHAPQAAFSARKGTSIYSRGNRLIAGSASITNNSELLRLAAGAQLLAEPVTLVNSGFSEKLDRQDQGKGLPVNTDSESIAAGRILAGSGATLPRRDAVDFRIVQSVRNLTGKLIESQRQVGGWPELKSVAPEPDRDQDGIPDEWEKAHGLNPDDQTDGSKISPDGSGYSNLEIYLNSLVQLRAGGLKLPARAGRDVTDPPAFLSPADSAAKSGRIKAFPGAEGFGAWTPGGRGGRVLVVTNLVDYDPNRQKPQKGSFRAAIMAQGPRVIVFAVSGNIDLKTRIEIANPFVTIAGQTSPGGICLRYSQLLVRESAHDVIIRHLRWRPGDHYRQELDGIWLRNCHDVIVDHCSVSWSTDEVLSATRDADYLTVQWCFISEALNHSFHSFDQDHGLGSLIDSPHASFHHNLYAHNRGRNPRPGDAYLDWRNNVIYDWNGRAGGIGDDDLLRMNYINNYLKAGPSTKKFPDMAFLAGANTRIFIAGNVIEGYPEKTRDNPRAFWMHDDARAEPRPFPVQPVTTDSAREAFEKVLAEGGATRPSRDAADARVAQSVREGTGRIIDSQEDVGGWPELKSVTPPKDTDRDGIPDDWETAHGLNPNDPSDASAISANGYSNLENYLNSL